MPNTPVMRTNRCSAMGCNTPPKKGAIFCKQHWEQLPEELRAPSPRAVRAAIIHLGQIDGYLVPSSRVRSGAPPMRDHRGTDYV